ncbi:MAG: FHA domain-containing protein [Actinomycetota bacterium]|nr:FHA domain-containing protein [Actinomycetota bacterium]
MVAGSLTSAALPGAAEWDLVVGERFIAAVAAPAPDASTTALAEAAGDERVTIESLVACIPIPPGGGAESFAIVWWPGPDPTEVTAVVRGDAVVDLTSPGGTRRFDARGIRPWHLAEFGDVIALRITASAAPLDRLGEADDPVPHARASLRASSIEWASWAIPPRPPAPSIIDADTILIPRGRGPANGVTPSPSSPPQSPAADDTVTAAVRILAPDAAMAPDGVMAPDAAPAADLGPGTESAATTDEPPVAAFPSSEAAASGVPTFRIGDGPPRPIVAPVLIGRRPLAPRIAWATGVVPELLAVESPGAIISGTHLELRVEGSRLVATDLRSTNGTFVRTPAGTRRMRAGESIVVSPGTTLDLGDGTIVEILLPLAAPPERSQTDSRPHP